MTINHQNEIEYQRIYSSTKQLIICLINGRYKELQSISSGIRLSAEQLQEAVKEYGHKLIIPPENQFEELDVIEVLNSVPRKWSVRFDLWTEDEGRSDLTLEFTLIEQDEKGLGVELDNLHVL